MSSTCTNLERSYASLDRAIAGDDIEDVAFITETLDLTLDECGVYAYQALHQQSPCALEYFVWAATHDDLFSMPLLLESALTCRLDSMAIVVAGLACAIVGTDWNEMVRVAIVSQSLDTLKFLLVQPEVDEAVDARQLMPYAAEAGREFATTLDPFVVTPGNNCVVPLPGIC